ncbi:biopolymer transporter ExbB [Thioploca ingrica]|uniref:Biopolymer transporter ExbB n=1 Tax=Thioploca ingrica TaxID=40754 RepID=A0A090AIZ5_9GAMM|nr:biopolymer transporter ExbB [Thioploca ingrica]
MEFLLKTYLDYAIFGLLGLMSFLVVAYGVERHLYYRRVDLGSFAHPEALKIALTANLTTIASVGSNAPYVGLLGTVLGILVTFHDLGSGATFDTRTVMLGLALALKATALGLVVAIPSILLYNGLLRRVDELTARWQVMRESS